MTERIERTEDLYLLDMTSAGNPAEEGQVRRVSGDLVAFVGGAVKSLTTGGVVDVLGVYGAVMDDPSGFPIEGGGGSSTISKVDGTRTFSITPTGVSFTFYVKGELFTKSSQQSVVWPDTEGVHYFYFDTSGVLQTTMDGDLWITVVKGQGACIAYLHWNADDNVAIFFGEERHGIKMPGATHAYLHESFGAQYVSGGALGTFTAEGDGSLASHAQLSCTDAVLLDEDLEIDTADAGQTLTFPAQIPIFFLSGAAGNWRRKTADTYPVIYSGTAGYTGANGRLPYNQWTGATWQLTELGQGYCVIVIYWATADKALPIIGITGQTAYNNIGAAREALAGEFSVLAGIARSIAVEAVPLGAVIFQTATTYTNAPKARIRAVDAAGSPYVDLRGTKPTGIAASAVSPVFADSAFRVYADSDLSKQLAFQCSGIATATTRVVTVPDVDVNLTADQGASTPSLRTLGTTATSACAGNDSRLSDGRTDANAVHKNVAAEISTVTEKTALVSADVFLIEDSAASYAKKRVQVANLPGGVDTTAIHKATAAEISAMTEKTTPVSADVLVIEDSAAAYAKKRIQIGNLPGGTTSTTLAVAMARRTTTVSITSTWTDISFDETTVETNPAVIDHLAGTPDRIQVLSAGTYLVSYLIESGAASAAGTCWTRVLKNDVATALPGSDLTRAVGGADAEMLSAQFVVELAANDWLSVQIKQYNSTLMTIGARFVVVKLDGMKGDTGSGSTVTVQHDGIPATNTPHHTLNFGNGLGATDGGSGVANVVLEDAPPVADNTTKPATPLAGSRLFTRFRAGRRQIAQIDPLGLAAELQPALSENPFSYWAATGIDTTSANLNFVAAVTGTATARTIASGSLIAGVRRLGYVSSATAGNSAGIRLGANRYSRGSSAGLGGFLMVARFTLVLLPAQVRFFVGMTATTTALANANPSTLFNLVGLGMDSADTLVYFMHNDSSGVADRISTGIAKPPAGTSWYEARLFAPPQATKFYWSLENLTTGTFAEGDSGVSTNIPSSTTFLNPQLWVNNGSTASAASMDIGSVYMETND